MNIREFFACWDNPYPALCRVAKALGHPYGTIAKMLEDFGDLQIADFREEVVGDSYTGRMRVYVLTLNEKVIRVF